MMLDAQELEERRSFMAMKQHALRGGGSHHQDWVLLSEVASCAVGFEFVKGNHLPELPQTITLGAIFIST